MEGNLDYEVNSVYSDWVTEVLTTKDNFGDDRNCLDVTLTIIICISNVLEDFNFLMFFSWNINSSVTVLRGGVFRRPLDHDRFMSEVSTLVREA